MMIHIAQINELINLPTIFNEKNIQPLCSLYDKIETYFRVTDAQDIDKLLCSSVVVPTMFMSKTQGSIRNKMISSTRTIRIECLMMS